MTSRTVVLALTLVAGGCKCGETAPAAGTDASPAASSAALPTPPAPAGGFPLSLPFATSRGPGGDVYVAGLIAARGVIGVARMAPSGTITWVTDALTDVAWTPDAEVRVLANDKGLVVVWRGMRSKALVRQAVSVDGGGKVLGAPQDVGPGSCVTDDGLVWSQEQDGGSSAIVRRPFSWGDSMTLGTGSRDLDPELACASHRVFVLEEGEEDIGLSVLSKDGNKPTVPLLSAASGSDDGDEHSEFTDGDDLGVLRATASGKLFFREATPNLARWRALDKSLEADDDVVAVDGDHAYVYVVATREASARCDGAGASDVRLVRGRRGAAKPELKDDDQLVSAAPCGTDVGPFWTGSIGNRFVVAWAELAPRQGGAPPIGGLAYQVIGDGDTQRIAQPADGITFAGCDDKKCYAVALTRTDADAMAPGAPKVLVFP